MEISFIIVLYQSMMDGIILSLSVHGLFKYGTLSPDLIFGVYKMNSFLCVGGSTQGQL